MAVRLNKEQTDRVRSSIKTSQLINRLQKYAVGELSDEDISQQRIRAIEILLRKTLPDISAVQISGDSDNPLTIQTIQRAIIDPANPDS